MTGVVELPEPTALAHALERAVENHPYAAAGKWDVSSHRLIAEAELLWQQLMELPKSLRPTRIATLSDIEVRLLAVTARTRLTKPKCLDVLDDLLAVHRVPEAAALAWDAYLLTDGREAFRDLADCFVRDQHMAGTISEALVKSRSPVEAACGMYVKQSQAFREWAKSTPSALADLIPFFDRVRERLVRSSSYLPILVQRERPEDLAHWAAELVPTGQRDAWQLLFLITTYEARDSRSVKLHPWLPRHPVLMTIHSHHGEPDADHPFWRRVPDPVRTSFLCWIRDQQLTTLLGENDRVQFWRHYLRWIVRSESNRDRDVVFIHFDRWFAVQFKQAGTATYIFQTKEFRRDLQRMDEPSLAKWVRTNRRALSSYEHRGSVSTWQLNAAEVVREVREFFVRKGSAQ